MRALIDASVRHFNGVAGQPRSFDRPRSSCSTSSRIGSRTGASRPRKSTIGGSSTSTSSRRCGWKTRRSSTRCTASRSSSCSAAPRPGLRVDHVDGLYAPATICGGCRHIADRMPAPPTASSSSSRRSSAPASSCRATGRLPARPATSSPRSSTTCSSTGATSGRSTTSTTRFVRERRERLSFGDLAYRSKKQVMHETMSGDINSLGHQLNRFSERNRHFRDFTLYSLISTIKEVIACFPVYRTYVTDRRAGQRARPALHHRGDPLPRSGARPASRRVVFDFIERLLLKQTPAATPEECEDRARFIGKFQQITSPVAAKGIEDTALYVYNRLLSLNEVGADPTCFGLEPAGGARVAGASGSGSGRARCRRRRRTTPSAARTCGRGSTCCRRCPARGRAAVRKWRALNRRFKTEIDGALAPDSERGVFPLSDARRRLAVRRARRRRARAHSSSASTRYMTKALREAKVHTSWLSPDEEYEDAVQRFVEAILDPPPGRAVSRRRSCRSRRVSRSSGIYNSLAQLADQDHRARHSRLLPGHRAVGPESRRSGQPPSGRLRPSSSDPERADVPARDGQPGPGGRAARPSRGTAGSRCSSRHARSRRAGASARRSSRRVRAASNNRRTTRLRCSRSRDATAPSTPITCVPRLIASVVPDAAGPPLGAVWLDTRVELAATMRRRPFAMCLTGATIDAERGGDRVATIAAATLFEQLPGRAARCALMLYLTIIGGVFIAWLILVVLFTPHIPYHVEAPIDPRSDHFIHVLESTCNTMLDRNNKIEILTNGTTFYPAMLDAIRGATETINLECYIFKKGEIARPLHRRAVRAGARRRAGDDRARRDRQLRRLRDVTKRLTPRRLPRRAVPAAALVQPGSPQQSHPPRAAGRRRPRRVRRRRRRGGLVVQADRRQADVARHDGADRRADRVEHPGRHRGELARVLRRDPDQRADLPGHAPGRHEPGVRDQELAGGSRDRLARAVPDARRVGDAPRA